MLFEFQLDNDILGPQIINECDGWKDAKLKLERDKNFHSLIEYFDGSFIFYGNNGVVDGGIDYIKEVEQTQGFDAEIRISIRVSLDGYNFVPLFSGQLNLSLAQEVPDNKIQIPIVRDDFWSKFINRLDTPVDIQSALSLDDVEVDQFDSINLKLTPQKLRKKYRGENGDGTVVSDLVERWDIPAGQYGIIDFTEEILSEITTKYSYPITDSPTIPFQLFDMDYAGSYRVQTMLQLGGIIAYSSAPAAIEIYFGVTSPGVFPFGLTQLARVDVGTVAIDLRTQFTLDQSFTFKEGDNVRFFIYNSGGVTATVTMYKRPIFLSYLEITGDTVHPESNAFSFFAHDAIGQICDRIISENQSFYSEHLGSDRTLYRQYEGDGCGWKYAIAKGLQIRQYSLIEKPFFMSFNQWWKGINPVLCLGLAYEEVNGSQVVRIEEMDHFYDASTTSLDISNVRDITRLYDQEVIFKTIKVGYSKWQSEDISGIDDPQTKHTYATRFVKTGTELNIESDFIAASLAIETTRRTTRIKSADYKFDNDTFLIAINPIPVDVSPETSPDVNDYTPELDENFSSITNLLNADTRYNSRITPARNLMRWIRYISGALQSYIDSKFKFVSGEGNYDMTSDMANVSDGCDEIKYEISEKQDLPVYNDPLHLALSYEIRVPLEWEDYLTIRENRKKAIGISQGTTSHVKFFIDTLEYELVKGVATIKAWPIEYFDIQVQEEVPAMRTCIPAVVDNCDDAYLTEDSFEYETEAGECLILN